MYLKLFALLAFVAGALCDPTVQDDLPYSGYRLPSDIIPVTYDIAMMLDDDIFTEEESNGFMGFVTIQFTVKRDTNKLCLHVDKNYLAIEMVAVNGEESLTFAINETTNIMTINYDFKTSVSSIGMVTIIYNGTVSTDDMFGFYKSRYTELDANQNTVQKYLLTTQFESTYARRAFPCFDEPALKANFTVAIVYKKNDNLIALGNSNGITSDFDFYNEIYTMKKKDNLIALGNSKKNTTDFNTKYIWTIFETTPIMSTYLIAFTIAEFTNSPSNVSDSGVEFQVYSRPSTENARQTALEYAPKLLKALEEYTNLPYDSFNIKKIDQVAIPDFAVGAMENWGLVTYRESALLFDAADSSISNLQRVVTTIAHEFAHLWFSDIVTTEWWSDAFLNEGFATYFEFHITDKVVPEWQLPSQIILDDHQLALEIDSFASAQALHSEVETVAEINAKFGDISYSKGGSILRMVQHFLGEAAFQAGLQLYLNSYKEKSATPEDLWRSLETNVTNDSLPGTLKDIMENYVSQSGYPVVSVTLNDDGSVSLEQKQFLIDSSSSQDDKKWIVPISFTTSKEKKFEDTLPKKWLTSNNDILNISVDANDWIILNIQETAYYRVKYDSKLLEKISDALNKDNFDGIHELNRAQIVDDLFSLARAGEETYELLLSTLGFLKNDVSYFTWSSAFKGFDFILNKFESDTALARSISELISSSMEKLFSTVKTDADDHVFTLNRAQAYNWACKLGNQDCIDTVKKSFKEYKNGGEKPDVNIRSTVYCYALANSDDPKADWDALWSKYLQAESQTEQLTILSSLGCVQDENILNDYLNKSITNDFGIRQQDALTAFSSIYSNNRKGVRIAYEFLKQNYAAIQTFYATMHSMSNLIKGIATRFTTQEQIDDFKKFLDDTPDLVDDFKVAAAEASETAASNLAWVTKNQKVLEQYFENLLTTTTKEPETTTPQDNNAIANSLPITLITGAIILNYLVPK